MEEQNLSEVLFKPQRSWVETSLISNSGCPLPELSDELQKMQGFMPSWYRSVNRFYWSWLGGNPLDIEETLARIAVSRAERSRPELFDTVSEYGPGNWVYEFSATGQMRVTLAKEAISKGADPERIAHQYRMASRYFAIASYPNLKGDVLASQSALLCRRAYREIFVHSKQCGHYSEESFTVNGTKVQGFLHAPDNRALHPCILMISGYGQTATDFFRIFNDYMRPSGFAVFIVDMPGIGACASLPLDENCSEVICQAALHLKNSVPYIDSSALCLYAGQISSMAALRMAVMHPDLVKAVIVNNPVVHELFVNQEVLNMLPLCLRSSIANRLGADASSWDTIIPQLQMLSLKKQGLLSVSAPCPVPFLLESDQHNLIITQDVELLRNTYKTVHHVEKNGSLLNRASTKVFTEGATFLKETMGLA